MAQQRLLALVNAVVLLFTVQVLAADVSEVPSGAVQTGTEPARTAPPAVSATAVVPASQVSTVTVKVEGTAPQTAQTSQTAAPTLPQASPAKQPTAATSSQQAAAGAAQTAAAAAETAAVAAQTAAAAAASAAQSAAAAAGTPSASTMPPTSPVVSPVVQQIANMGTNVLSAAPGPQAVNAEAAVKAATNAASMEKTAAAAAVSAASAAKVADTAAGVVTAQATGSATSPAPTGDDATKANAAAIAAASAQRAADSAASAAASAANAAQAATTAEKTVTALPSAPAAQAAAPPEAKPPQAASSASQPQAASGATGATSPGVQITASVPVHVSEKELQHLPPQIGAGYSYWSSSQWWWMQASNLAAGLSFAMVVKALCVAGNVMVQVSPLPQVRRWEVRQCTGEADAAPYVSIAFGGWQWCFYGLFAFWLTGRSGFLILVHSNCLGAVLGTYYVYTFFRNCRHEDSLASLQKYLSAVTALALLQVCAMSVLPAERALFLTGLISSFCGFIGATSVLVTVPQVVRNKDSRSIPGPYACANLCSSIIWSLCGWMLDDPLVMVPSLFSTCCAMTALSCKALYPSSETSEKEGLELEEGEPKQRAQASKRTMKPLKPSATVFTPARPVKAPASKPAHPDSPLTSALIAAGDMRGTNSYDGTGGTC